MQETAFWVYTKDSVTKDSHYQRETITKEGLLRKRNNYRQPKTPRDKIPKKRELLYAAPLFVWCDEKTYAYARVNGGVRLLYEKEI